MISLTFEAAKKLRAKHRIDVACDQLHDILRWCCLEGEDLDTVENTLASLRCLHDKFESQMRIKDNA